MKTFLVAFTTVMFLSGMAYSAGLLAQDDSQQSNTEPDGYQEDYETLKSSVEDELGDAHDRDANLARESSTAATADKSSTGSEEELSSYYTNGPYLESSESGESTTGASNPDELTASDAQVRSTLGSNKPNEAGLEVGTESLGDNMNTNNDEDLSSCKSGGPCSGDQTLEESFADDPDSDRDGAIVDDEE